MVEGETPGLDAQAYSQNQHRNPDGGAGPVLEFAHGFHAVLNDQQLQRPDDHVTDDFKPGVTEEVRRLVKFHDRIGAREQGNDGARSRRRLRAVPEAGDDGANKCRQVGAPDTERRTRQYGIRNAGLLAGVTDEIHQRVNDHRAQAYSHDEIHEAATEQEQAGCEVITPQTVHVRGPHVENTESTPVSFLGGGEVLVIEAG